MKQGAEAEALLQSGPEERSWQTMPGLLWKKGRNELIFLWSRAPGYHGHKTFLQTMSGRTGDVRAAQAGVDG